MSWDWFNTAAGAASVFSLILGAILGTVTWLQNRATNKLIAEGRDHTHTILERMNALAEERHRDLHGTILGTDKELS